MKDRIDQEPIDSAELARRMMSRAHHNLGVIKSYNAADETKDYERPLISDEEYRQIMTPSFIQRAAAAPDLHLAIDDAQRSLLMEVSGANEKQLRKERREAKRMVIRSVFGDEVLAYGLQFVKNSGEKANITAVNEERARVAVLSALIEAAQSEASGGSGIVYLEGLAVNIYQGIVKYGDYKDDDSVVFEKYRSTDVIRVKEETLRYCFQQVYSFLENGR